MADAATLSYLPLSLATALFVVLILLGSLRKSRRERGLRLPPSPPSLPVIGHLHLFKKPLHRALANLAAAHGPVLLLRFGSRRVLHVADPAAAEECLTAHDVVFANRPRLPSARHLSNGYTTLGSSSYGTNWRNLRRIATVEVLSAGGLLRSAAVRADEVRLAARRLFLQAAADGASGTSPARADVKARAFELALNVVARMIAGKRYYGGEGDVPEAEAEEAGRFREMVREYFAMHGASNLQDFLPVLRVLDVGGANRRAVRLARKRNEWAQRLIDQHRAAAANVDGKGRKGRGGRTMVGDLLDMQAGDPEAYSDKVIGALCLSDLMMVIVNLFSGVEVPLSADQRRILDAQGPTTPHILKIIFSEEPTSKRCILAAIFTNRSTVGVCRVGCQNRGWSMSRGSSWFSDIAFCHGKLYGLDYSGDIFMFDIGMTKTGKSVVTDTCLLHVQKPEGIYRRNYHTISYIFKHRDKLLMAKRAEWLLEHEPFFRVFELIKIGNGKTTEYDYRWEEVMALDDHALFLSEPYSKLVHMPAGRHGGLERNHIYYNHPNTSNEKFMGDVVQLKICDNGDHMYCREDLKFNGVDRIPSVRYYMANRCHTLTWVLPPNF